MAEQVVPEVTFPFFWHFICTLKTIEICHKQALWGIHRNAKTVVTAFPQAIFVLNSVLFLSCCCVLKKTLWKHEFENVFCQHFQLCTFMLYCHVFYVMINTSVGDCCWMFFILLVFSSIKIRWKQSHDQRVPCSTCHVREARNWSRWRPKYGLFMFKGVDSFFVLMHGF